jgi:glutaminyl-tRNA synthetase
MTEPIAHFIHQIIEADLAQNKNQGQVVTRFPPEPNGYLHIGHAKSICLNFDTATRYKGCCNLRFDDTNPCNEEAHFADAIEEDVRWMGYAWDGDVRYASDYFDAIYDCAVKLIQLGKAYVCCLNADEMKAYRGTLTEPGKESPYRNRSIEENLDLFSRMKAGEFKEGSHVLRAKIDMNAGNINLRDPVMYRIRFVEHERTGDTWCIYPMYDFTHALSDAFEGITHSLCTLEFQDHRPLYDWYLEQCNTQVRPQQIEFSRLNLSHTIASKRKLKQLVEENHVSGWDDPRMPTLAGMRRRGYPPAAIKTFCEQIGISKSDSIIDMSVLEACVRDTLNQTAYRAMCVLDPIKVILTNFPEDHCEVLHVANHPFDEGAGTREIPLTRELYIDRNDFMLEPCAKYFRLSPGKEVRLRHAYIIRCDEVQTNEAGEIVALHCQFDPETLGKNPLDRKVKGVIHWVPAKTAQSIEVRCYDRLFKVSDPGKSDNISESLNPNSLKIQTALLEPAVAKMSQGDAYQFERVGYFVQDKESQKEALVFNQVVGLRDVWQTKE